MANPAHATHINMKNASRSIFFGIGEFQKKKQLDGKSIASVDPYVSDCQALPSPTLSRSSMPRNH